jgi:hypothetical protein
MAVRLALRPGRPLPTGRFLVLVDSRAIVRLEGLGQLKNPATSSRTRDLPACSVVPQPTTLSRKRLKILSETQCLSLLYNRLLSRYLSRIIYNEFFLEERYHLILLPPAS